MEKSPLPLLIFCLVYFLMARFNAMSLLSAEGSHMCGSEQLAVYNLVFQTYWTKQNFPKQYPENRPPAQWSKVIGMSHDVNYSLFRVGETASKDFKMFAETGRINPFGMKKLQHVFDEFSGPSIKSGYGTSKVHFFVDGNHSMVSLAARMVPSPDWFVGVDSMPLCTGSDWLDSVVIEASPMDAGTDSGYTFTAPNWETDPQEKITQITSRSPKHPANSFYYPNLTTLPVIAKFHLIKKKVYRFNPGFNAGEEVKQERKTTSHSHLEIPTDDTDQFLHGQSGLKRKRFKHQKLLKYKRFHGITRSRAQWKPPK